MKNSAILIALTFAGVSGPSHAQQIEGAAVAVDGTTLDMTGITVRLAHVLAPPAKETCTRDGQTWNCGAEARDALAQLIGGTSLTCSATGVDPRGGYRAVCKAGQVDIGYVLARSGHVLVQGGAPNHYAIAADFAKSGSVGLWASQDLPAEDWLQAEAASAAPRALVSRPQRQQAERSYRNAFGCAIKGNRSRRGEWIYHLPGQEYYEATRPEELFCTESEARSAGYRRAKA